MSISEREQQALAAIEGDLVGSGPDLAAKLAIFTRLAAEEEMPPRERAWRTVRASAVPSASPAQVRATPASPRVSYKPSKRTAWGLLLVVLTIAFAALAVTLSYTGKGICRVPSTAACQQAHASAPASGRSGVGVGGGP